MLASDWRTEILPVPLSMRAPFLAVIRLPNAITACYGAGGSDKVRFRLYTEFKVVGSCLYCVHPGLPMVPHCGSRLQH